MQKDNMPYLAIAIITIVGAAAFFAGTFVSSLSRSQSAAPDIDGLLWPDPPVLNSFELTKTDGQQFDLDSLKNKWSFLFFGFTQCPDICPTTLATLDNVTKALATNEDYAEQGQVVFVSIDPERDNFETLGPYVKYFNENFLGVTGSPEKLNQLTKQLGILFAKIDGDTDDSYTMDHSASILLIDPAGRMVGLFSLPHQAQDIAERFAGIAAFVSKNS